MVKRKKSVSKTSSKKRINPEEKIRGDFYSFQRKIARLEELKRELQSLQSKGMTKGFEKEISLMRSRLKDTTAIPELEKQIRKLRSNIRNKREIKKKSPIKKIEREVSEVGSAIDDVRKRIDRKVGNIGSEMEDSTKQLKNEIKGLKLKIDESLEKSGHVDSEVGLKVDEGFQNFVKEIKLDLSEKVKNKEKELNETLRRDLSVRRTELDVKYKNMEEDLDKNYQKKLQNIDLLKKELKNKYQQKFKEELDKEVKARFSEELKKKFEEERTRLDLYYISQMKKKYNDEFQKQKVILDKTYRDKISEGLRRLSSDYDSKKRALENEHRKTINKLKYLDSEKKKHELIFNSNLERLNKERMENKSRLLSEQGVLRKKSSQEAHERIAKEVELYKKKLDSELKNKLSVKMGFFINEQKKRQESDIERRTEKIRQALEHERKMNDFLRKNLSEKSYAIEKLEELNNKLRKDLAVSGKEFDLKYQDMEENLNVNYQKKLQKVDLLKKELKNKYQQKLKDELDKEVNERFLEELKKKFEEEKKKIDLSYISQMRKRYSDEMQKKKALLERKYRSKVNSELRKLNSGYKSKKRNLESDVNNKLTNINKERAVLEKKLKTKLSGIEREKSTFRRFLTSKTENKRKKIIEGLKDLEKEKKEHEISFNRKLAELNKEREKNKTKILDEQRIVKKRLEEIAHQKMANELKSHKRKLESELRSELAMKMNVFLNEQKKKQESDIVQRTDKIRQALEHEHEMNDILRKNLSEKDYNIEKLKELNRKTVSEVSGIKHKESLKRAKEHKKLIEQHRKDTEYLTTQLKKEFHSKFDEELQKHISLEKQQLDKEFNLKIAESREKMKDLSGREVREFKSKLRGEYDEKLRKNVELKKEKLQNEMRKQFFREANDKILLERQKLENKIKDLEQKYKDREDSLKMKEKHFVETHKAKSLALASEKKTLMEKMNIFKRSEGTKIDAVRKEEQEKLKRRELELAEKSHQEMLKELKLREAALKERLQKHFDRKIKEYKDQQEREITAKKAQLSEELREKAKAILG